MVPPLHGPAPHTSPPTTSISPALASAACSRGRRRISGVVSGQAWSTWKDGRFVEAEGTIHALSPGVVHQGSRRGLDQAGASFTVERHPEGWTLAVRDLAVATANGAWPISGAGVKWTPPREGREGALVVNAEFARIEDVVALAAPKGDADASPALGTLFEAAPGGAVEALRVSVPVTGRVELERARASGRFTRLRIGREDWPVSVHAANGRFEANEQGFMAEVVAGGLRSSLPGWLAQPLEGEEARRRPHRHAFARGFADAIRRRERDHPGGKGHRRRLDVHAPGRASARAERGIVPGRIADRRGPRPDRGRRGSGAGAALARFGGPGRRRPRSAAGVSRPLVRRPRPAPERERSKPARRSPSRCSATPAAGRRSRRCRPWRH